MSCFLLFSQGSVIVNYTLVFVEDTTSPIVTDDVSSTLKEAITNDEFGELVVDPDSIVHEGSSRFRCGFVLSCRTY